MIVINEKSEIIDSINNDNIVILPTDTVYGIMSRFSKNNEERINILKKCSIDKKISIIFESVDKLFKVIDDISEERLLLIKEKLPGKYTFIVNLKKDFCERNGFSRTDFGVRVTENLTLQSIIKSTGPLLATSCNKSKENVCTNLEDIKNQFSNIDIEVLFEKDGNDIPSTIIDLTKDEIIILR